MAAQSVDPWRMPLECVRPSLFCTEPFVCNSGFRLSLRGTINGIGIEEGRQKGVYTECKGTQRGAA